MSLLRGNSQSEAVNRTILFPGQMLRRFSWQTIERRDETKRRVRTRNFVAFHQVFDEQQVPNRREHRDEQNADGRLALVEQALHQH